jgi:hypothetical protein
MNLETKLKCRTFTVLRRTKALVSATHVGPHHDIASVDFSRLALEFAPSTLI